MFCCGVCVPPHNVIQLLKNKPVIMESFFFFLLETAEKQLMSHIQYFVVKAVSSVTAGSVSNTIFLITVKDHTHKYVMF